MSSADRRERLQKVLAHAGVASRRGVEEMIGEGRITVNGQLATLGQRVDLGADAVKVDGKRIVEPVGERRYLLVNKPAGYVSTLDDPEGRPTVMDLLPQRLRKGLAPVGRLDYETEGLLILTDDGELAQHIAHPRYGCIKTYEAKVKGRPEDVAIRRLRDGILLFGKRTAPADIAPRFGIKGARESVSNSWWTVKLGEGKTRQIREMFFRIGHPVNRLRRIAIGPVNDPRLVRGAWRELTDLEVEALRKRTARPVAKEKVERRLAGKAKSPKARPSTTKSPRSKSPRGKSSTGKSSKGGGAPRGGAPRGGGRGGRGGGRGGRRG